MRSYIFTCKISEMYAFSIVPDLRAPFLVVPIPMDAFIA